MQSKSGSFKINHDGSRIGNQIFWKGLQNSFEADTIWMWETLCNGSDVILDIGANVGIYSLIAKSENPNAKIIAFEPSRKIYPELIVNMDLNNFDIKCERIALSNSNKEQTFFDSTLEQFPTSGSLSAAKLKDRTSNLDEILEYTVVCTTLDDYVVNNNVRRIDLIKIDIELHEPELFEGFKRLQEFRPTIIVEVLNQDVGDKIAAASNLKGYHIYRLVAPYKLEKMDSITAHTVHRNVLLLPEEKQLPDNTAII